MSILCKVIGHNWGTTWKACNCQRCSETRHEWEGCKCKRCANTRNESHDWDACSCRRCGKTKHSFAEATCTRCGTLWQHFKARIALEETPHLKEALGRMMGTTERVLGSKFPGNELPFAQLAVGLVHHSIMQQHSLSQSQTDQVLIETGLLPPTFFSHQ